MANTTTIIMINKKSHKDNLYQSSATPCKNKSPHKSNYSTCA